MYTVHVQLCASNATLSKCPSKAILHEFYLFCTLEDTTGRPIFVTKTKMIPFRFIKTKSISSQKNEIKIISSNIGTKKVSI